MAEVQVQARVVSEDQREVFVGPRPFERSEKNLFFGRDREVDELLSLVTSNRIVLCYAPSGAGKTSLINAGLRPQLETEGFEVLHPTRVRGLIPEGVDEAAIPNIYVFNALLGLARDTASPAELTSQTISGYLATLPHLTDEDNFPSLRILIFDQFEELITSYLERWQEREGFFKQVGDALRADPVLRILFVMREDYLARIEPFMRGLKPLSQSRFRLDLLGPNGAKAAVVGPLRGTQRYFKDGVVDSLIEELLKVRVESTQGDAIEVVGEYVEPVQLQVVCRNLWNSLPADVQEISHEHVKAYGDVDQALRDFYESCLTGAKTDLRTNESDLRQWFERQLITPAGTRSIVFRDAQLTAGLSNDVVDLLENRHIIRGEWRAGSRWYELTHDRLIEPIHRANEDWRRKRQARTSRMLTVVGGVVVPLFIVLAGFLSFQSGTSYAVPTDATLIAGATAGYVNATSIVAAESTTVAIQSTSEAVQADASLSKSRQLAAEALLVNDRDLSLLLAIEANKSDNTLEARRSLHIVLSEQGYVDGTFVSERTSDVLSPKLVRSLNGHQGSVVSVAFSPDGQRFVSGSGNGTVLIWDVADAQPIRDSLTTQRSSIESVAYSPDARLVASAGQDLEITLWDANTGERVGSPLRGHEELVTCLAFSPDGKLLASGSMDRHILLWDVASGELVDDLKDGDTIASLAWSPDGLVLAAGTFGPTVSFWMNEEGIGWLPTDTLSGLSNPVRSIAWSPDGELLAFGLGSDDNAQESGDVILWDYEGRQEVGYPGLQPFKTVAFDSVREGQAAGLYEGPIHESTQRVRAVAFHPSGKIVAVGRDDGTITFWDIERDQILGSPLKAHRHWVMGIDFSPDGRYLISGSLDGTVALWSLLASTSNLAVNQTGNLLAASQGSVISLWDLSTDPGELVQILSGHTADVLALAFSPDGKTLASSGEDNIILYWDVETGQQTGTAIRTLSAVRTLQFSPDGKTLAAGGDSGRAQLSNALTGQVLHQLVAQDRPILKVQFGADGNTLDVVGSNGSLVMFDLTSTEPRISQENELTRVQSTLMSAALSGDGKYAAYFLDSADGDNITQVTNRRAHGIDISSADQSFDPNVNKDDIDFIVIRATEGTRFVDPKFEEYVNAIQSVPIRGAYHYFKDDEPWKEQADHFLATVKDKGFHFYVLDLEVIPKDGSIDFLADAEQWLKYVDEQVDGKVLLGTGSFYLTKFGEAGAWMRDWPLLVMQYPLSPDRNGNPALPEGFRDWRIWNYTDKGDGTEFGAGTDRTDLLAYNGSPAEMRQWLGISSFSILNRTANTVIDPTQAIQLTTPNGSTFSPDGSYLAIATAGSVKLLDPATGEEISALTVSGRSPLSLSFLPGEDTLAIGTDDGTILFWDLSLLKSAAGIDSMIEVACSQVQQNFTQAEWAQYYGSDAAYQATCPNSPVP